MVSRSFDAVVFEELDDADEFSSVRFEKMPRRYDWWMPSRKTRPAQSASVRTPASRRTSHELSKNVGGKHRRKRRIWNYEKLPV